MTGPLRRAWLSITEPRHMKVAYVAVYAITCAIGIVTLISPPQTIEGQVGPIITTVWATLFIAGGMVGMVAVLPGWWWVERLLAIAPVMIGLGVYLTVVTILHVQTVAQGSSRLTQIGIILLASAPFTIRALVIREYSYEPRR